MARRPFLFEFDPIANPYIFDRGASENKVISRFFMPPDMTDAQALALVTLAGGRARTGNVICPDAGFSPRKVTFVRSNGNSFSIAIGSRADHLTAANLEAMRAAVNAISAAFQVVCMKLEGEFIPNLIDELRTVAVTPVAGTSSRPAAAAGIQYVHSGVINYTSDALFGTVTPLPVKVDTDLGANDPTTGVLITTPPTILGANWAGCVGAFVNTPTCGGTQPRSHRRYIADYLVTDPDAVAGTTRGQRTEIPVSSNAQADILTCGQNLAASTALICIGYKGEDNDRLHKFLAAAA